MSKRLYLTAAAATGLTGAAVSQPPNSRVTKRRRKNGRLEIAPPPGERRFPNRRTPMKQSGDGRMGD